MKYICNPINMEYKYQFIEMNGMKVNREAADPSLISFDGKYFLFPSMTGGFLVSDNLVDWEFHSLNDVPIYDYAPDVRIIGDYMYFTASNAEKNGSFYRTKDPIHGHFEEIEGTFPFWDPNLFVDDDGRVYFYWGCSNAKPIYGIELQPEGMKPIGEPAELIFSNQNVIGYERNGENHIPPKTPEQIEQTLQMYVQSKPDATEEMINYIRIALGNDPYIEGAWMDKHEGKYYLQYSSPGTQYNVYSDGVYVSDHPLGPFTLAKNNPYSFKPGGFIPGAGHGSTMEDRYGNFWHASTMRISMNHMFERRLGLWPAGFDQDGELYCNQRYGDWPMKIEQAESDTWSNPRWMLLSYNKPARASTHVQGKEAGKATDENVQTWWRAATNEAGQYLEIDLMNPCEVHAIQINFADDQLDLSLPDGAELRVSGHTPRYIDHRKHVTRWLLEGSLDGKSYFVIEDKSNADTDLAHDLIVREEGLKARFIRCTVIELPYRQQACISGLRVFGMGIGERPIQVSGVKTDVRNGLDLTVAWNQDTAVDTAADTAVDTAVGTAVGYNVLWGFTPEKLYHSYMVLGKCEVSIGALIKGEPVYVRVDAFNETGITEGEVMKVI